MHSGRHICFITLSDPAHSLEIFWCSKRARRHICFAASSDPANSLEIFLRCMCAGRHICFTTLSDPAHSFEIFGCSKHAGRHIFLPLRAIQPTALKYSCAACGPANIYVSSLQAWEPMAM